MCPWWSYLVSTGDILTVGAECLRDQSTTEATTVRSQAVGVITLDIAGTNNFVHKLSGADVEGINISIDGGRAGSTISPFCLQSTKQNSHTTTLLKGRAPGCGGQYSERFQALTHCTWRARTRLRSGISATFAAGIFPELTGNDLQSFPAKPGERLNCGFYSISAVDQKSRALRRLESSKLPHDASSWARRAS